MSVSSPVDVERDPVHYHYDAEGTLFHQLQGTQILQYYHHGERTVCTISGEANAAQKYSSWLTLEHHLLAQFTRASSSAVSLLASDMSGSVQLRAGNNLDSHCHAPYGYFQTDTQALDSEPAYKGEFLERKSGCYLLGAGTHRPYSPTLGIFLAPDVASPFGAGGLNGLCYCASDPINRTDPSGHFWKWVIAGIGLAIGAIATAATFGAASIAVGAVMAGGIKALTGAGAAAISGFSLGVVGAGVEVAAVSAMAKGDDETAGILGWVGLGLGVASALPAIAKSATALSSKLSRFGQRVGNIKYTGLSGKGSIDAGQKMAKGLTEGGEVAIGKARLVADDYVEVLQTHGAPFTTETDGLASGGRLARQMRSAAGENYNFRRIELQSCYSATGGTYASTAQRLSNELGVPVSGFRGKVGAADPLSRGRVMGDRYMFMPQTGSERTRTAVLNSALHRPMALAVRGKRLARGYFRNLERAGEANSWM